MTPTNERDALIEDASRKEFVAAMRERLKELTPSFKRYGKPAQDQYIVPDVQAAWIGWQAARESLEEQNQEVIDSIIRDVAELPDRNSPDDFPDAMLVTADELEEIIQRNFPS